MILSRLPVQQVFAHLLPFPADPGVPGMPRIAVEAVVVGAVRRRARDHDASRVLRTRAAHGAGRGAARDLRRRRTATRATRARPRTTAARSRRCRARPRRSSPATSISSTTIRCTRGWRRRSPTARRRWPTPGTSRIPASRTRRRSASTRRSIRTQPGYALRLHLRQRRPAAAAAIGRRRYGDAGLRPPAGDRDARRDDAAARRGRPCGGRRRPFAQTPAGRLQFGVRRAPVAGRRAARPAPLGPDPTAAAAATLTFTGERFLPEVRGPIWYEHWHRYAAVAPLVRRQARARRRVRRRLRQLPARATRRAR